MVKKYRSGHLYFGPGGIYSANTMVSDSTVRNIAIVYILVYRKRYFFFTSGCNYIKVL